MMIKKYKCTPTGIVASLHEDYVGVFKEGIFVEVPADTPEDCVGCTIETTQFEELVLGDKKGKDNA